MNITNIEVTQLFGLFNHKIALKGNDRITIIHGPNGFGKTAILRMVDGLFNSKYSVFWGTPFASFTVVLANGTRLQIEKKPGKQKPNRRHPGHLQISLIEAGVSHPPYHLKQMETGKEIPRFALDEFPPFLRRVGPDEWQDLESGRVLSSQDVLEQYANHLPFERRHAPDDPEWLKSIRKSISVHLISTERLRTAAVSRRIPHGGPRPAELAVVRYSQELAETIRTKLAESAALSSSLDRTFPARLVENVTAPAPSDSVIRNKLAELEQKRTRLKAVGLLDKDEDPKFQADNLDDHTKRVLTVYVADTEKKLSVFGDLAAKLALLQTHANSRFLYKRLAINKEHGFVFLTEDQGPLSPSDLSSGEQHELVLLYELLFRIRPGSLILLDEPEISLHVAWQEQFLKDLQRIIGLSDFDVLIATHSPQIINDRWDLTVELTGPSRQEDAKAAASSPQE
jgi:predicted ATP-binding protein involved in virulence